MKGHSWKFKKSEKREARGLKNLRVFFWECSVCGTKTKTYADSASPKERDSFLPKAGIHTTSWPKDCDRALVRSVMMS